MNLYKFHNEPQSLDLFNEANELSLSFIEPVNGIRLQTKYKDIMGRLHKEDGPAYTSSGIPEIEAWYWHGKLHRLEQEPAYRNSDGKVQWWINGVQFMRDEDEEYNRAESEFKKNIK